MPGGKKMFQNRGAAAGNKRWIQLRRPHDLHFDFLLCPRILEHEFCSRFETLEKNDHAAGAADAVGGPLQVNSGIREMTSE